MKNIGVRFCGGCNPRYDRGAAYRWIKSEMENNMSAEPCQLEPAAEGTTYDALLIIGGCSNCCAGYDQFTNNGPVIKMWAEEDIPAVLAELQKVRG